MSIDRRQFLQFSARTIASSAVLSSLWSPLQAANAKTNGGSSGNGGNPKPGSGEIEEPYKQYRVLEWKDLVPEGWESPLLSESYDAVGTSSVDKASVVQDLNQQLVALPGFMKPVVFAENHVTEFLLVPFLQHHTRQHAHLDPNQMVYVKLLKPLQVQSPFAPLWVVGTIKLEAVMTDEGPAAYRIADAVTTKYEY